MFSQTARYDYARHENDLHVANPRRARARWLAYVLSTAFLASLCGCPVPAPTPGGGTTNNGVTSIDPGTNKSIDTAATLDLSSGEIVFQASIKAASDVNVFSLGNVAPGDHIVADIQATSGNLDGVAAVFDGNSNLVDFNDDRDPNNLDPLIDFVLRANPGTYYLAIIGYPGERTTGQYQADVKIERQVGVPPPRQQVVFLDWRGGTGINVPNVGTFDIAPFDATQVGLLASETQTLKDQVEHYAQSRYAGLNLVYLSSDHDAVPSGPHSTVYFDGFNAQAFAISESIDSYNQNFFDSSVVFSESFQGAFTTQPTLAQMATGIGNTVAHETGHLLGLVHTRSCDDLMDTTCSNDRILSPQAFSRAPLDGSVFPFGFQPEADLLLWILGPSGS